MNTDDPQQRRLPLPIWLLALIIGLVALIPRVSGLNDFYTIDEGYHWPGRVERFSAAIATGDWAATDQTGHPGVTTMWLGSLGRLIAFQRGIPDPGWAGGGAEYLSMLRLPLAIVNALAVVLAFLLLLRLLPPIEALLAGLMWACSPFLIAHSRLLHLDALLTSFISLSILLLLIALRFDKPWWAMSSSEPSNQSAFTYRLLFLIGSGACAGLALLTKAPSLILLPYAGFVIAGTMFVRNQPFMVNSQQPIPHRLWSFMLRRSALILVQYLIWLTCAIMVVVVLWPAMWVNPIATVNSVVKEIVQNGGQPHDSGNYFLGQPVADPGSLFYLAVVALRTTPLTLIGLILCMAWLAGNLWTNAQYRQQRLPILVIALIGFVLLFGIVMSSQAKKLDRYLLPIWPMLELLAAIGLLRTSTWLIEKYAATSRRRLVGTGVSVVIAALLLLPLPSYHPYYLAYYNPLLGGGPTAQRVILVGTGEGMDQVGAWLRNRPDLNRGDILSWIPPTLAPFIPKEILVRDLRPEFVDHASSYAVLYIRSVQHQESAEAEAAVRQTPALFSIRIHGIEYASIHQLPRPYEMPLDRVFDNAIHLRGISHQLLGNTLVITPSWDIQADRAGGVFTFIHVLDAKGQKVGQVDAPIDQGMFATWQAGQQFDGPLPIPLPAALPAGNYRIVLGVYEPNGGRLPLTNGQALPPEIDGPQVIELLQIHLP